MKFGEIVFYIVILLIVLFFLHSWFFRTTEEEKEYERIRKESQKDDFIYNPETGTKITLEDAESGHWITHDNLNRIKGEKEIERNYSGKEKQIEKLVNHVKVSGYVFRRLKDSELSFLEKTTILGKYDDWSYSGSFSNDSDKICVFFPTVLLKSHDECQSNYIEPQILFWLKKEELSGHFYLREKSIFDSFVNLFKNDEIKLDDYKVYVFKKSENMISLIRSLNVLSMEKELEIEIVEGNLLVKTLRSPSMEDFVRIERIIKTVCQ